MRILKHKEVCAHPYDVFTLAIFSRTWAFGIILHDYEPTRHTVRIMLAKWHFIFRGL
jgi:hypothetical protein